MLLAAPAVPREPCESLPQQTTVPSSRIAQKCTKLTEIATAVLPGPREAVWVGEAVVNPEVPPHLPQQEIVPSSKMTQVSVADADIATAVLPAPREAVCAG